MIGDKLDSLKFHINHKNDNRKVEMLDLSHILNAPN